MAKVCFSPVKPGKLTELKLFEYTVKPGKLTYLKLFEQTGCLDI